MASLIFKTSRFSGTKVWSLTQSRNLTISGNQRRAFFTVKPILAKSEQPTTLHSQPAPKKNPPKGAPWVFKPVEWDFHTRILAFTTKTDLDMKSIKETLEAPCPNLNIFVHQRKRRKDSNFLYFQINEENGLPLGSTPTCLAYDGKAKDFFIFDSGVIVGWGISNEDQKSLQTLIVSSKDYIPYQEDMGFVYGQKPGVDKERDIVTLTQEGEWTEKVVFSLALARCVKLDEFESEIDHHCKRAALVATNLMGAEKLHKSDPKKFMQEIIQLRYNLFVQNFQGTPGWLWDKPNSLSTLFEEISNHLDLGSRAPNLNTQLDMPFARWEIEDRIRHASSALKIEVWIVLLILVSVIFQFFDKSELWQDFTWEQLIGISKKKDIPEGYEIVEEIYEVTGNKNSKGEEVYEVIGKRA